MKFYIILFTVVIISAHTYCKECKLDSYYGKNEEKCSAAGGMCILKSQCENLASGLGLCPNQQSQGFECCSGVPKDEYRCKKFGGECFKAGECRNPYERAKDCKDNEACCILL